jgi:4-amino-4-deoxy-L-arabinose transferase-like glycosyltransferase
MSHSRRDFFLLSSVLVLILVIAAGLRFYDLGSQSLWSDEGNSAAMAARSLADIAGATAHDIHPPFYYWLLHLWTRVFGTSEAGLRSLSATLGVLLVLSIAELGRRLYGRATGLAVAFVAAVSPFQVYYSQEARMYILVALLATAGFLHFWWFIEREDRLLPAPGGTTSGAVESWSWLPYTAAPLLVIWVLGLYTHYAFPLVIGVMTVLYVVWAAATRQRGLFWRRLARWGVLLAVALACYAPWLPVALQQVGHWPTGGVSVPLRTALETTFAILAFGPASRSQAESWQIWSLVALAGIGMIPWRLLLSPWFKKLRSQGGQSAGEMAGSGSGSAAAGTGLPPAMLASMTVPQPVLATAAMPLAPASMAPALPTATAVAGAVDLAGTAGRATLGNAAAGVNPVAPGARGVSMRRVSMPGSQGAEHARSPAWYWVRWLTPVLWLLGPLAMMFGLGLFRDAYLKFLLIASPAYALLIARGVVGPAHALGLWGRRGDTLNRPTTSSATLDAISILWATIALAFVAVLSLWALQDYYTNPRLARDDYRGIVQFIQATAQPDDAVLLDAPGQAEVFNYYFHDQLPVLPLPGQRPIDRPATMAELNRLPGYNKVYVLYWGDQEADPDHLIEGWLDQRGYKTLDQWHGNVRLAVYVMPEQRPPDQTADNLNLQLGDQISLLGYRAWNLAPHAGEVTQLQLQWHADQAPQRRYKVFYQLLDPRDQVIAQRDAEPSGDSRPTSEWRAGNTIEDNHGLLIPPGTPPGTYRRIVGLYDLETLERLRLPNGEDHIDLPPITVARSTTAPPLDALGMQNNQSFDFGGMKLLGYDRYKRGYRHAPETPIVPGDRLHVTFYWQANVQPRADWWFDLSMTDNAGHVVAELQAPLVGPAYSTTLWEAQEIVRGEHDLALPANLSPDTYRLSLTLLPDTNTPAGSAYLGTVRVEKPGK